VNKSDFVSRLVGMFRLPLLEIIEPRMLIKSATAGTQHPVVHSSLAVHMVTSPNIRDMYHLQCARFGSNQPCHAHEPA
jgi:hypothetical protein